MKKIFIQSISIGALIAITFAASMATAGTTAVQPPGVFPANNTEIPINVGNVSQIKGGSSTSGTGLSVGAFIANMSAQFAATTYLIGTLTGSRLTNSSTLSFGDSTSEVDLLIEGSTYTREGGLYSQEIVAPTGVLKPLCATKNGDIIICPSSTQIITGTIASVVPGTVQIDLNTATPQTVSFTVTSKFGTVPTPMLIGISAGESFGIQNSGAMGTYTCTVANVLPNKFQVTINTIPYDLTVTSPCP